MELYLCDCIVSVTESSSRYTACADPYLCMYTYIDMLWNQHLHQHLHQHSPGGREAGHGQATWRVEVEQYCGWALAHHCVRVQEGEHAGS